jgi:hypothetical protein
MPSVDINLLAVIFVTILSMVLGAFWYSPNAFGNTWLKMIGKRKSDMTGAGPGYAFSALASFITTFVLAHFVYYTGAALDGGGFFAGMKTGMWIWLGFAMFTAVPNLVFEQRKWGTFWIYYGYQLVFLALAGGILSIWT